MTKLLFILVLLAGCAPEQPVQQKAIDDGCVGYRIKPDGSKECMRR